MRITNVNLPDFSDSIVLAHGGGALLDHEALMFLMPVLPIILIAMIVLVTVLDRRGLLSHDGATVPLTNSLATIAAALSLAAGAIHFAVIQSHLEEDALEGMFFIGIAWFQLIWPQVYLLTRRPWIAATGALVNAGIVGVWVISRIVGLPIGPTPWQPQSIGTMDLFSTGFEVALVAVLIPTFAPRLVRALATKRLPYQQGFVLAAFGIVTVALLASVAVFVPSTEQSALDAFVR